ncbi:MAG: hypothetical protein A2W91_12700 [Bacteroidetes bacterium GWF2_38_335]|nr:MAG: hypothetical protein A2W91_12700 [Bacteroidetes bacterium GWF2_38_335]OFY77026.1 MAG: hypothetical protein A2281_00815 [Bacteroidetes bacterium RIFOXYA12_FULL_38_20]HBS86884.1 hypothetical protein [Bacteroidales bacterium]
MRVIIIYIILVIFNSESFSQISKFNGLYCKGPIPRQVVSPVYIESDKNIEKEIKEGDKQSNIKSKTKFVLSSSYFINELMSSGKVVFNDTISQYLNQIKNLLLTGEKELSDNIQVFLIKSPVVNAFAAHGGNVFVTTGLLSRLNTEAELAYILSHEISHIIKKHSLNAYIEKSRLFKNDHQFKKLSDIEKVKTICDMSKENEKEADVTAYTFFHKTLYNKNAPYSSFEILKKSVLPFDTTVVMIDSNFITKKARINNYLNKIDFSSIEQANNKKDSIRNVFSSHPGIEERIATALQMTDLGKGEKDFLISAEWFSYCKQLARIDNVEQLINSKLYDHALYYIYLLDNEIPNNEYINTLKIRLFYEVSKIKKYEQDFEIECNLGFDFQSISVLGSLLLAYEICYQNTLQFGESIYSSLVLNDINSELSGMKIDSETEFSELYDFYLKNKSSVYNKSTPKKDFALDSLLTRKERIEHLENYYRSSDRYNKILLVDPSWNFFDTRNGLNQVTSEKRTIKFNDVLFDNARKTKLDIKLYAISSLDSSDIKKFNNRIILLEYVNFCLAKGNAYNMIFPQIDKLQEITTKEETSIIALTSINSLLISKSKFSYAFLGIASALSMLTPMYSLVLPYSVSNLLINSYITFTYFIVFDTKNESIEFADLNLIKQNSNLMSVNSYYFEYFELLTKSKKKN